MSQTSLRKIGPVSGIYYNKPSEVSIDDLKWDVFYAVPADTPESGDEKTSIGVRTLPKMKMASILHIGSYRKARSSYKRLEEWIKSEKLMVCGPSEEVYISAFGIENEEQMMEIRIPVSPT
jgi:effector-binding domain-containing protein